MYYKCSVLGFLLLTYWVNYVILKYRANAIFGLTENDKEVKGLFFLLSPFMVCVMYPIVLIAHLVGKLF